MPWARDQPTFWAIMIGPNLGTTYQSAAPVSRPCSNAELPAAIATLPQGLISDRDLPSFASAGLVRFFQVEDLPAGISSGLPCM